MTSSQVSVVCTLAPLAAQSQLHEWADLRRSARSISSLPDGARLEFDPALQSVVEDLVDRESACCSFLDITVELLENRVVVALRSPNPEAQGVIALLAGTELQ